MFKFSAKKENLKAESCSSEESSCCSPQPKGNVDCPKCNEKAKAVLAKTVEHLITDEAKERLSCFDGFYFCKTPSCEVVYFRDFEKLTQQEMRVVVGCKDGASPATLCYCFDWTKEKIRAQLQASGETNALEDIKAKMQNPGCSCETLNPSGECCLGDVSKAIKELS